ncbi:MAG: HAMP domain-containing sensor histidine kinase [Desulfitobacteriaceae bacterium]|nr:HAMP domain-containing sensor histidine kinase [Desulfitobacteriaceae bacterium]
MDIRWKKYSYSWVTKTIVFFIAMLSFSFGITTFANIAIKHDFSPAFEKSYYQGTEFMSESSDIIYNIKEIAEKYKSEEHILNGGALSEDDIVEAKRELFYEFCLNSKNYNPNLSEEENFKIFQETNGDKIAATKNELIQKQLQRYQTHLSNLEKYEGITYYAKKGESELTNSTNKSEIYFQSLPAYIMFEGYDEQVFPEQIKENVYYQWLQSNKYDHDPLGPDDVIYVGFSKTFLDPRIEKWTENKTVAANSLKIIAGMLAVLLAALAYLVFVIGRKPGEDEIQINFIDRIYNDIKLLLCIMLIISWIAAIIQLGHLRFYQLIFPISIVIGSVGLVLVLSLVKSLKMKNLISYSLVYTVFYKVFKFFKDIYDSGSVAIKVLVVVVAYPFIAAATFFMFPITIGVAIWLAHKRVKEFNAIKEGVQKVKEGDLRYTIDVPGDGELAHLASDINSITDGLNNAIANELKSERMKTELITNVSHDIRTPLTSIITYVDLLKNEKGEAKRKEYIEVLEQKSQRLKILTDDLFEASKASTGNIPVNFEKIELVSLITQGLGELDDKIQGRNLEFKLNHPEEKIYIKADGKLFWRAVENLFANILKYALEGSRVYIEIIDSENAITLVIKNISAYELNISADELMERFKRGDESRTSQGSGLGLSIAKSLIELQQGNFQVEIDGDLFKALIQIPKC